MKRLCLWIGQPLKCKCMKTCKEASYCSCTRRLLLLLFPLYILDPWKKLTLDPTGHSYLSEEVFKCSSLALVLTAFGNWILQFQLPCCTYWLVLSHCPALVLFYTSFQIIDPERKSCRLLAILFHGILGNTAVLFWSSVLTSGATALRSCYSAFDSFCEVMGQPCKPKQLSLGGRNIS